MLIIDNLSDNFKLQQNNGLAIKSFIDDMKDTHIIEIGKILKGVIYINLFFNIFQTLNLNRFTRHEST